MSQIGDLVRSRELLANLTRREISGKYKRTALGQLWSLVNPLAQMAIFWAVFSFVIRIRPDPGDPSGLDIFAVWLLCGLLPWAFFSNVVNNGMASLVGNENLIKKVWFPRLVLPVSSTMAVVVSWAIEMAVLTVVLVVVGGRPLVWVPLVVVAMALLMLFSLGVALMFAVLNVYFRDTQHFIGILMQAWFYATPVIYPTSYVASASADHGPLFGSVTLFDLYRLNPMEQFLDLFRTLLYDNRWPSPEATLAAAGWAAAALALGLWVFSRHQRRLAEVL